MNQIIVVPAKAGTHSAVSRAVEAWIPTCVGMTESAMATEAKFLMTQFLAWIEDRPRTIAETRAAWSSTCPLNCAWEDAVCDDLVACGLDGRISLTARGRERLIQMVEP
jgi:hypothetical protein